MQTTMHRLNSLTDIDQTNFSEFNRPHDRCERAPTRGRPSAGCWGFQLANASPQ